MQKIYSRINWENFPSEKTAVNESNLNKMDLAIDNLDDRVVAMDASKVDLTKANELVKEILWDESNGTLTVVKMNGSRAVIDTKLEKLAVNFTYNPQTQQLVIALDDGTVQNVDLSSLITEYEFLDSDTIAFEIAGGKVKAIVKNGSITENHLAPEYLAEIRTQVGRAEMSAKSADASEKNAASSSALAKSYAVGGTGTRDGEDTDNAKYYAEQAKNASDVGALSKIVDNHISDKIVHMTESEHDVVSKLGESAEGSLTYNGSEIKPSVATTESTGVVKPDGTTITIDEDGTLHGVTEVTVDDTISSTSTNPVQNKVVKKYVDDKASENVDFSTSTSKLLNDTVEAPLVLSNATRNLLNPTLQTITQDGVTCTNNGDGTYTLNGTSTKDRWISFGSITLNPGKYKFIATENNVGVSNLCVSLNNESIATPGNIFTIQSKSVCNIGLSTKNNTFNNVLIKPMITTDLDATYDDFVPYSGYDIKSCGKNYQDGGTVHIDSTTEFPLLGLKSFDGETNIISPGNVEVTYAKSDSGKAILDMSENKLDKDNVVNNQTTTVEGFALDARQANPNLDGTLAKQISDLNGSLSNTFITSKMNVGAYKQLSFDFSAVEQIVFMWFFYPTSTNSVSLYVVEHHEDSKIQLISATDTGYNPEIVNSNGTVSISFSNNYMGYMMFSTSKLDITIY